MNLENGKYNGKGKKNFDKDIRKIFDNSKTFNKPNTFYYQAAVDLEKFIEKDLSELTQYI